MSVWEWDHILSVRDTEEKVAPPWKLSQIVEIRFFRKFQGTKILGPYHFIFPQGVLSKIEFLTKNVHPFRKHFHISHENQSLVWNSRCLVGKNIYVTNICTY